MRAYLVVIKDSFREALASRVLWIVLILITLLLLLLSPFGYRETLTLDFRGGDIPEPYDLIDRIRTEGVKPDPSPERHIWGLLDESKQKEFADLRMPGGEDGGNPFKFIGTIRDFPKQLNKLIHKPDFLDKEAFESVELNSREGQDLSAKDEADRSAREQTRLNRLYVEAAFPQLIHKSAPTSVQFTYLWGNLFSPQRLRTEQIHDFLEAWVSWLTKIFVGALGIFIAVLVTAPIVPQMFETGSLHLLLSKPVSRSLLLLVKFAGGCAFILLGATYLIGGFWLILGLRFGVWDAALLLSIPIYLFVFAVYYSVATLAGVIWRNPVVSIGITILFWVACFTVGAVKTIVESRVLNRARMSKLIQAKDTVVAVNELGFSHVWNEEDREWNEAFVSGEQEQMRISMFIMPTLPRVIRPIGPVYDEGRDQLLAVSRSFQRGKLQLRVGERRDDWKNKDANSTPPMGTIGMVHEPDGKILIVSSLGIFRIQDDPLATPEPISVLGFEVPLTGGDALANVGPDPAIIVSHPAAAAINQVTGELALYSRGKIFLLRPDSGGFYSKTKEMKLEVEERQGAGIAFGGNTLLVALGDGRILAMDATTFEWRAAFRPEKSIEPRFVAAAHDGKQFAVLFHSGRLYFFDPDSNQLNLADVAGQGTVSGVTYGPDNQLLVADRTNRVSVYSLSDLELQERYSPKLATIYTIYRYIMLPMYTLFPKPGELDRTFDYLLSGKETTTDSDIADDLEAVRQNFNPWTPLWSSAAFMMVILLISCVYIEYQEF